MDNHKNKQEKNFPFLGFFKSFSNDQSLLTLIASNFLILLFAVFDNWSIAPILFIFWFESVVIGVFTFFRLLFFDHGVDFKVSDLVKNFTAFFFIFHYGMFHFVYLIFIIAFAFVFSGFSNDGVLFFFNPLFLISLIIIICNKAFSEIYNAGDYVKSFNQTMIEPYARIIPMHLTLIFGSFVMIIFGSPIFMLILFLILKTGLDISGHKSKHSRK
jgi:hypothetical protein